MNARGVFMGPGGIRAGWRFAAFAALWYAGDWLVFPLASRVHRFSDTGFTPEDLLVYESAGALYMIAVSALLVRLERHRMSWFGFSLGRGVLRLFGTGCLWGCAAVTLLLLIGWSCGYVRFGGAAEHGAHLWRYLLLWLAAMLVVGLDEELQFRGYALASLTRGLGFWPAAAVLSLAFAGAHVTKPMETAPDIINIVLLGLFTAYSVLRTGSLWFAIGFHAAFDFFALAFYGSPNTGNRGLPLAHHLLDTHIDGPAWLTGGAQGLEASWLLPALLLLMAWLLRRVYPVTRYPHD